MSILVLWFCAERFLIRENGARLALHKIGWWPVTRTHLQASAATIPRGGTRKCEKRPTSDCRLTSSSSRWDWEVPAPHSPRRLSPILIFWHPASAVRRVRPRAHATLQSEAEGALYDRLSSDLPWRGRSQLNRANIADQKQAGWACYSVRRLLFEHRAQARVSPETSLHMRQIPTGVLSFCAKALSPRVIFGARPHLCWASGGLACADHHADRRL
jgi:hypothetical protein